MTFFLVIHRPTFRKFILPFKIYFLTPSLLPYSFPFSFTSLLRCIFFLFLRFLSSFKKNSLWLLGGQKGGFALPILIIGGRMCGLPFQSLRLWLGTWISWSKRLISYLVVFLIRHVFGKGICAFAAVEYQQSKWHCFALALVWLSLNPLQIFISASELDFADVSLVISALNRFYQSIFVYSKTKMTQPHFSSQFVMIN